MIEEELTNYIRNQLEIEPLFTKNKYKVKFSIIDKEEHNPAIEICVRILKISNEKFCV
jgi:hypothetical protein